MLEGMLIIEKETNKEYLVSRIISAHMFDAKELYSGGKAKTFKNADEGKTWVHAPSKCV